MVFEKFVVQLLDKYLSDYVENFDYKKLKIDMWSGNVVLDNLSLKANALADLDLPVIIKTGYLQKLKLQVPWKNLYTQPTKVTIDGLYLLVIPKIEVEYNAKQEEDQRHQAKMKEVDQIEKLRAEKDDLENNKQTEQTNDTFSARMKLQIVQNLELSIHNIHIVYEDKTTKPNHPFAFGVTLNSITFQTTNKDWIPTIMKENSPVHYKLGELNALAIYWNTDIKSASNDTIKILRATIAPNDKQTPPHMSYIFRPFNVKAKLIMTLKARQQNFEKPMFHITIDLDHISLNLTRTQYLDMLDLLEYQDHMVMKLKYIKYRPKKFGHAREKWKFAYHAIVNEQIRARFKCYQWQNIKLHLSYCKEYRAVYYQELIGKITNEQRQRAEELEKKLDVFNLTYNRRLAQIEAKKKKQEPKTFFKSVFKRWSKKSDSADPELNLEKIMSDEEKKEFYQMIGYEGEDISTSTYPKEYIDIDMTIRLLLLDLNIWSKINQNDRELNIISHANLPDTQLIFRRRPATSSALFFVSLGSFQVFGISEQSNQIRPVLIQSIASNDMKLLQVEFAINPTDKDSGYRLKIISQSLEFKYHAPTIDNLIQCFQNDSRHNLQGVKQVAYTTYADVKNRSMLLMKSSAEQVKTLDIYIDLQSSYFILPEKGIYSDGCPVLCVDLGHLVFQQNKDEILDNYTQFRLELKKFQLLYANRNEDWRTACQEENTRLHLIKPITLYTNISRCIYTDHAHLPAWKISGQIPEVNIRISDMRLFRIMQHLQSFSFPQTKKTTEGQIAPWMSTTTVQQTLETIDSLTEEKVLQTNSHELVQIEGNFELSKIDFLLLEEERNGEEHPFLRLSFVAICAQTRIKTFDSELQASLDDLIILHEQFITGNDSHLRILAAQHDENQMNSKKLVAIHIVHTSSENPLFTSSKYGGLENRIRVHLSKFVVTLHSEAVLSIMRFQDNLMEKWPTERITEENKTILNLGKIVNKDRLASPVTLAIEAGFEEFRVIIATIDTQMFDIYVQGVKADMHHTSTETTISLILTDFCLLDPNRDTRYPKIISQQTGDNELLSITMVLFNYPKKHIKALDDIDCDIKIHSAKANIIFLFKYIDQLLGFLDALNISKAALQLTPNQSEVVNAPVQILPDQAFKLRLNATFNAPNIIIPINSSSNEALFLDLGELILQTSFLDHPTKLLIEQQQITIQNVLASRIRMNDKNEIESEINLLKCAKLQMDINRLLYQEKVKTEPYISMNMQWDFIHFQLSKTDYACVMKILTENFGNTKITNVIREQYQYRQERQKREEDELRNAVINKQKEWQIGEILEKIRVHAEIKKLAITLYLDETHLIARHVQHAENSKLANVEIDSLEIIIRQSSDSSYRVILRVKNFLCDDLRTAHQSDAIVRVMDRHHTVDRNAYMLVATLEYKPKDQTHLVAQRKLNVQLESLCIGIKFDYLMILQEFFLSGLPVDNSKEMIESERRENHDVETRVEILVKNPEIILLEDQRNSNSNCLVLNLALKARVIHIGNDTKILGEMNDLTVYSSNLTGLKSSKIKHRIFQPAIVNLAIILDPDEQKIDVGISNIIVNITPAVIRILLKVSDSFDRLQSSTKDEKFDIQTMFSHRPFNEGSFWFLQRQEGAPMPSKKSKTMERNSFQQFVLSLKTIELKLDLDFDSRTKSVAALCLSNWMMNLNNWSNQMTLSLSMDIEAALYNERTLAWDPFIEPVLHKNGGCLTPWNISCSIKPILPNEIDRRESKRMNEMQKAIAALDAKQLISLETNQHLNITITKTGFELINHLSSLLTDQYDQRLPEYLNHNKPMLSLVNLMGKNILIRNLHGLEFTDNPLWTSTPLESNALVSLTAFAERSSSAYRLSVLQEQTLRNRQEFSVQINDTTKLISINRTWQRIYNLPGPSPIEILCDTQIHHNQRTVTLSSIVKVFNNTNLSIVVLDFDGITGKTAHRIASNEEFTIPIDLLYQSADSPIFLGVDESGSNGSVRDMFVFDWRTTVNQEEKVQLHNGQTVHLILHKESKQAYSENTDQFDRLSFCIYIHSPIQFTNLLPISVQISIDNNEEISLNPNAARFITSGDKNSILRFMIPFYDQMEWTSDPVHLGQKKKEPVNEQIVIFRHGKNILRLVLYWEIFHQSYRLSLYTPFWINNHTYLKLEFQIENEKVIFGNPNQTYFICPEKYTSDSKEKGQIRLSSTRNGNSAANWSEKFSLDVIKSIGIASCKVDHDKTYMICVDIATSSFGLTKIISLTPAMVVINQTSITLEIVETISGKEQSAWQRIEHDGMIPFWPQNSKDSLMLVRYPHNLRTSKAFLMNKKHQTLLYMNDKDHLVIFVEVIATDFDGVRMIFSDYKPGDAPILLVNYTRDQLISYVQKDEMEVQYLIPEHFVYYTWNNPLKPRELIAASDGKPKSIELYPHRGVLHTHGHENDINYVVFIDDVQTVLLFTDNQQIVEMTLNADLNSICRCLQLGIPDVGLSIVNDLKREELLYISLNKSKVQWVEMKKSRVRPFSSGTQSHLEEIYRTNPNKHTKYSINKYRKVTFHGQTAQLMNQKGERKTAKRQSLHGLWIEYTWSRTNAALYARINRAQIDNQLDCTSFPSMLYPVLPKTASSDAVERSFIELSIYETKTAQSNSRHIQYCKLLIQEFALRIDQSLILAMLAFLREEKNSLPPTIDMRKDLEHSYRSLRAIIKAQTDLPTGETQMYFDSIHLSPLQIHISFSMHGSTSNEELFDDYPLVGFLLKTSNVAEVHDVVLRLGFYERLFHRYTLTKLKNEITAHYQNQFLKQIHVLVLGLDVLGNPLGIIRGLAEGVESLFYEPYKGAIEGPVEFAEGVATGVLTLVGSTVGTTVGAISKITGVLGKSLATLTFDDEYQASRIRYREPANNAVTDIAKGGKNVVMGFFNGITGIVTQPIDGAINGGAAGFASGLGKGLIGVVAKPTGAVVDFATTSLNVIKTTATQEQIVRRVRYPRHVGRDGLVRPYIAHEAMGSYILNRLESGKYAKTDTYVAHITCSDSPPSWCMATSKRVLFVMEISFLGLYEIEWIMNYVDLQEIPTILLEKQVIQILLKKPSNTNRPMGKVVRYQDVNDALYLVEKITNAMHSIGL